jgi:hypothetical protein
MDDVQLSVHRIPAQLEHPRESESDILLSNNHAECSRGNGRFARREGSNDLGGYGEVLNLRKIRDCGVRTTFMRLTPELTQTVKTLLTVR